MSKYRDNNYIRDEDKPNDRQMSAENYLKEHNIEGILAEMINYLLHKRFKSPLVGMIKYLGGLLTEEERKENGLVIPDPQIDYHPIVTIPKYAKDCNSLLKEYLQPSIFGEISKKISKFGINANNIMRLNEVAPENNIGCFIGDADCLTKFAPLYNPIICKVHDLKMDSLKEYTQNNFNLQNLEKNDLKDIDLSKIPGLIIIDFSVSRNLPDSPFVYFLNSENRSEKVVKSLKSELVKVKAIKELKMTENPSQKDANSLLRSINYDMNFFNAVNPNNNLIQKQRIIYEDDVLLVLVNYCDNLQLIYRISESCIKAILKDKKETLNERFIKCFNNLSDIIRKIQYYFGFEFNHKFGYLTSNIATLGRGFSITSEIDLDKIYKEDNEKLREKFDKYTDTYRIINDDNENPTRLIFTSSPKISQESIPEFFVNYFKKIEELKNL